LHLRVIRLPDGGHEIKMSAGGDGIEVKMSAEAGRS
jgi:hypothetical protein